MPLTSATIVCAHSSERLALTLKCIGSVLEGDEQPDEIIVVVDGNAELQSALEEKLGPKGVRVLASDGSGAAAARTCAARQTKAELCLFIDDDAWAEKDWHRNSVSAFEAPEVAGIGGRVIPDWAPGVHELAPELLWVVGSTYRGHPTGSVPISRPIGANMALRTEVIAELGGFPAQFGPRLGKKSSSNEELALSTLITRRHGPESLLYVPTSVVHHHVAAARTTWRYLIGRSWAEGTSKADIRKTFRGDVLTHDSQYLRATLLPAILRYGVSARWRYALQCILAVSVTASGYVLRSASIA